MPGGAPVRRGSCHPSRIRQPRRMPATGPDPITVILACAALCATRIDWYSVRPVQGCAYRQRWRIGMIGPTPGRSQSGPCARRGVVAAQSRSAAEIGAEVLRAGGNAVDAAIATSLALGVVEPWMSGLGGGGCMLVRLARGQRPCAGLRHGGAAPARSRPPTRWPAAPPVICSAGRPCWRTATCMGPWPWRCPASRMACVLPTSDSGPCHSPSSSRPP